MRVAIVEDNLEERERLIQLINRYAGEQSVPVTLTVYEDGIQAVDQYRAEFDVIYFDVQMPVMDGMTAAKKIRRLDKNVIIVFITNYVQWAVEGYSVQAFDFMLKPLSPFGFQEHFKKLLRQLESHQNSITIKSTDGIRKIALPDLYYVESEGHYLHFHTVDEVIDSIGTMKNTESELREQHFFRCNNGYLVNLNHVKAINGNLVQVGDDLIQISRPRKKDFMAALTDYLGSRS